MTWTIIKREGNTGYCWRFDTKAMLVKYAEMNGLNLVRLNKFEFAVVA